MKTTFWTIALLTAGLAQGTLAQSGATSTDSCAEHLNTSSNPEVGALLNCLVEMQRDIEELKDSQGVDEADIRNVVRNEMRGIETGVTEAEVRDMLAGQGMPNRIVVASTVTCRDLGDTWLPFDSAQGRMIVGVGATKDARGEVRQFNLKEENGAFMHKLTVNEMPRHTHNQVWGQDAGDWNLKTLGGNLTEHGAKNIQQTGVAGSDKAHNNVPPYIALYFCTKSG